MADAAQGQQRLPACGDDPAVRAWAQLARTYNRFERRLEQALDAHGLSLPQFEVLARLHFDDGMTQNELAGQLLVSKGNVCGLVGRLEAAGLIDRRPDPDDRRANRLSLTALGRRAFAAAFPEHLALVKELMSALEVRQLQHLSELLNQLDAG
jgi:MarR family transcriptional regulator, organic hydroperoxide resistance regulator